MSHPIARRTVATLLPLLLLTVACTGRDDRTGPNARPSPTYDRSIGIEANARRFLTPMPLIVAWYRPGTDAFQVSEEMNAHLVVRV